MSEKCKKLFATYLEEAKGTTELKPAYDDAIRALSRANEFSHHLELTVLWKPVRDTLESLDRVVSTRLPQQAMTDTTRSSPPAVLIVDDEAYSLHAVIELLEEVLLADVVIAANVEEAVELLESNQPIDVLICDMMLPVKATLSPEPWYGGLHVCRRARELRGAVLPILCLTVVTDPEVWQRYEKVGINARKNKPVLPTDVVETVVHLLQRRVSHPEPSLLASEIRKRRLELKSNDPSMRIAALWALHYLGEYDDSVDGIIEAVAKTDPAQEVKVVAVRLQGLCRRHSPQGQPTPVLRLAPHQTQQGHPVSATRRKATELRKILTERFSEGELRTLCYDQVIDYESLPGDGKAEKALELVAFLERHNRISDLVRAIRELRPDIDI